MICNWGHLYFVSRQTGDMSMSVLLIINLEACISLPFFASVFSKSNFTLIW